MSETDEDREYAEALAAFRVARDRLAAAKKPITERRNRHLEARRARYEAAQAAYWARHDVWVAQTRLMIKKADAGADVNDLAAEFGLTPRRVREAVEQCRWVFDFEERDLPMLAEQCLR